ncbi:MAG: hypothetical protein F4Z33_08685 [Gemmatimonadales bacterium]|nr:hypothetical protein [Gemmatimonadales bacterium]MYC89729.1 hypothetical protein [Candidatus Palauibacter denitrificans]
MVRRVKLRRMGGSIGVTLPREMAQRLHLAAGDEMLAVETASGILLTPTTRMWTTDSRSRLSSDSGRR